MNTTSAIVHPIRAFEANEITPSAPKTGQVFKTDKTLFSSTFQNFTCGDCLFSAFNAHFSSKTEVH